MCRGGGQQQSTGGLNSDMAAASELPRTVFVRDDGEKIELIRTDPLAPFIQEITPYQALMLATDLLMAAGRRIDPRA